LALTMKNHLPGILRFFVRIPAEPAGHSCHSGQ
jgi:hypothetical protein